MKTCADVMLERMSGSRRRATKDRRDEKLRLLLLIERPLLVATGAVGRPWCRLCAFNGTKIISAWAGCCKDYSRIFAEVWGDDGMDD